MGKAFLGARCGCAHGCGGVCARTARWREPLMPSSDRPNLHADPDERRPAKKKPAAPRKRRGRWWQWGLLVVLWTMILGGGVLTYFALTLPSTNDLAVAERRPSVTLLAADGTLLATFGDLFGEPLDSRKCRAICRSGDRDRGPPLLHHFGIDLWAWPRRHADRAPAMLFRAAAPSPSSSPRICS